eukprot:scaffold13866_cov175-Amphora_coffeaeformis.AAC.4
MRKVDEIFPIFVDAILSNQFANRFARFFSPSIAKCGKDAKQCGNVYGFSRGAKDYSVRACTLSLQTTQELLFMLDLRIAWISKLFEQMKIA